MIEDLNASQPFLAGDTVKLRGLPKDFDTKRRWKQRRGRGNDLGYGNNSKYGCLILRHEMGNPQPSPNPIL